MANPNHMHERAATIFCLVVSTEEDGLCLGFIQEQEFDYFSSFNLNIIMIWGHIWCFTIFLHIVSVLHHSL